MKALVISGFGLDEERGPAALAALRDSLEARGLDVDVVDAVAAKVSACVGCGSCGLKTPGRCVVKDDMQAIYPRLVACDVLVLAGPVSFGAHCYPVKKIVDRLQPFMQSLYTKRNGELKFRPRYPHRAAWMGVGLVVGDDPQREEQTAAFRLLIERHAVNVAAPAQAAAVFGGDDVEAARLELDQALDVVCGAAGGATATTTAAGSRRAARAAAAAVRPAATGAGPAGRVLVIQGSPRKRANTRAIVAALEVELRRLGTSVDVFHVPAKGAGQDDLSELQRKLRASEAVVLAAPLYIDGLPPVTQLLLEQLAARRAEIGDRASRVYGLAHSGFPEPIQRETELRTMALFAGAMGWVWQGGVGFGGTSPIDGRPLDEAGMFSKHLRRCLPHVAADIAAGGPFSEATVRLCDKPPFAVPLWLMIRVVNRGARKAARESGVELEGLPYAAAGAGR